MSVTKQDVIKISHLARMDIPEAQIEKYTADLNQILGHVEQLGRLDTRAVPATFSIASGTTPFMRPDEVRAMSGDFQDQAFTSAPDAAEGFFIVPKVIE